MKGKLKEEHYAPNISDTLFYKDNCLFTWFILGMFYVFHFSIPKEKKSVKDKSLLHFCRNVEGILLKYNAFTAQLGYLCSYR